MFLAVCNGSSVLHPQYKLHYFHDANWQPAWILTAENILRVQWTNKYKNLALENDNNLEDESQTSTPTVSLSFISKLSI